ncbi:MAG: TerB family tellurite resistance protein [Cystobacterineae bacterium]|nr:TerB family tellurite resistance protein [Cystobacterineae bacterium]
MLGRGLGILVGLMVGMLLMPWPWLLVPIFLGFSLGYAWDSLQRHPGIFSETPKTRREIGEEPLQNPTPMDEPPPMEAPTRKNFRALSSAEMEAPTRKNTKALTLPTQTPSEEKLKESRLARLLCPIFTQIAMADAPINQEEIHHIRLYFERDLGFSEWGLSAVRAELKAWLKKTADMNELLSKARPDIPPALRPTFVSALYELALADGELQRTERDLLQRVVRYLNLSDEQLQSITSAFFGDGSEHYALLGLEPQASDEEIKTAYRKLAAAHHPDSHVGMSPQQIEKTTQAFHQIKEAYEALKKIRGF